MAIKIFKLIIKKKRKKHDKIKLLSKNMLNIIDVLISMASLDSEVNDGNFFSWNNVSREYYGMKEAANIQRLLIHKIYINMADITNNHIKIKPEIDGKTDFYSHWLDCSFKKFKFIDERELSNLRKILNYI